MGIEFSVGEEVTLKGIVFEVHRVRIAQLVLKPSRETMLKAGNGLPPSERRAYLRGFVDCAELSTDRARYLHALDVAREKLKLSAPKISPEAKDPFQTIALRIEKILRAVDADPEVIAEFEAWISKLEVTEL